MVYAGFWRRFVAQAIDWAVISTIACVVWLPLGLVTGAVLVGQDLIKAAEHRRATTMAPQPHSQMHVTHTMMPLANHLIVAQAAPAEQQLPYTTPTPDLSAPATVPSAMPPAPQADISPHASANKTPDMAFNPVIFIIEAIVYLIIFAIGAVYHTWWVGSKWQATPGKRIMNCVVVTPDGKRIDYGHAFGRHMACILSWLPFMPLCIGFFLAGWTREKTGAARHDRWHPRRTHSAEPSRPRRRAMSDSEERVRYAGFWKRLTAYGWDSLIVTLLSVSRGIAAGRRCPCAGHRAGCPDADRRRAPALGNKCAIPDRQPRRPAGGHDRLVGPGGAVFHLRHLQYFLHRRRVAGDARQTLVRHQGGDGGRQQAYPPAIRPAPCRKRAVDIVFRHRLPTDVFHPPENCLPRYALPHPRDLC